MDDHPVFRTGLKNIVESNQTCTRILEAANGRDAIKIVKEHEPDLIIMDINMPGMDGIETTQSIKEMYPSVKVIILSMFTDEAYLKEALKAGASGYVPKKAVDTELLSAIEMVSAGETYMYPTLIPNLYKSSVKDGYDEITAKDVCELLSKREMEVIKHIALGYTHQEIADLLYISIKTVDTYKARIMDKLNLNKRSEVVRFAIKHHLIDLD